MSVLEIRALSQEEERARSDALELAARFVGGSLPLSVDQVQVLFGVILEEYAEFEPAVIALGVAFGELIAEKAEFEWVRVTDEWGSENSLSPEGWDICCHPISMIQKRLERREEVCLADLRDDTISTVLKRIDEGKVGTRESAA